MNGRGFRWDNEMKRRSAFGVRYSENQPKTEHRVPNTKYAGTKQPLMRHTLRTDMMKRMIRPAAAIFTLTLLSSCASFNAFQKARDAEMLKDWDQAIVYYEKALEIDPGNTRYKLSMQRARRESARVHFEKAKSLRAAALTANNADEQLRLMRMAGTELEL